MVRWTSLLGAAVLALAFHITRAADTAPASQSDLSARVALIRQKLASDDFGTRDSGQKELDQIPPAQADALRALAARESDPEVKARLDARVDAMELYILVHPAPLSLHVKDATLPAVAAELTRQLGPTGPTIQATGNVGVFSLDADNRPFWEILSDLNQQAPVTASSLNSITPAGIVTNLRLTAAAGAAARAYRVIDTFAVMPQLSGMPATGNWAFRLQGFSDPRVRITQYSQLRIEKITDQDGTSLLPFLVSNSGGMSTAARPVLSWSSSATFDAIPGVTRIKELRAGIALSILVSEKTVAFDLTKELVPLETPRGTISVEKQAGNLVLHVTPPVDAANAFAAARIFTLNMRLIDQDDKLISNGAYSTSGSMNLTLGLPAGAIPARLELTWPDKTRDMVLPVILTDIALPAPPFAVRPIDVPF